jgi:hypothetical protein
MYEYIHIQLAMHLMGIQILVSLYGNDVELGGQENNLHLAVM